MPTPTAEINEINHSGVLVESNVNLSSSQEELLHWHFHLCHEGLGSTLQHLLHTGQLGSSPLI